MNNLPFLLIFLPFLFAWYLNFNATRLDRLHHRVETSWANLDSILQRRAALASQIAHLPDIDFASNLILTSAATQARSADISDRSEAESGLSEALRLLRDEGEFPHQYPEILQKWMKSPKDLELRSLCIAKQFLPPSLEEDIG